MQDLTCVVQVRHLPRVVCSRVSKPSRVCGGLTGKMLTHLSLLGGEEKIGLGEAGILFYEVPQLIYEVPQLIGRRT